MCQIKFPALYVRVSFILFVFFSPPAYQTFAVHRHEKAISTRIKDVLAEGDFFINIFITIPFDLL